MKKPKRQPLTCSYGTPWLHHFHPPIGTGKGCTHCDRIGADWQQLALPFQGAA